VLTLLGLLTYPLVFAAFRGLADRGYIFSKTLGILLLAYFAWILASLHLVAFSHLSTIIVVVVLLLLAIVLFLWQRRAISKFLRQRWRLLLIEEVFLRSLSCCSLAFARLILISGTSIWAGKNRWTWLSQCRVA